MVHNVKHGLSVTHQTLGSKTANSMKATYITTTTLNSTNATTDSLTATNATTENHTSTNLTTDSLTATNATTENHTSTNLTTDSLNATSVTTENHTSTNLTTDSLNVTSVTADTITVNGTNVGDYIENGGNGTGSVTKSLQSDTINSSQTINLNSLINSQSIESGFISVKLENNTTSTGSIGMYGIGKLYNIFIYTVLFEQDTGTSSISLNSTTGELQIVTTETVNYDIKILNLF